MIKMLFVFFIISLFVYGLIHVIKNTQKEIVYNWIKKLFGILGAMVVASGIVFIFVQLF